MKMWPFIVLGICVGTWLLTSHRLAPAEEIHVCRLCLAERSPFQRYFIQKQRAKSPRRRTTP